MDKKIKKAYAAVKDNQVVLFDTNLKDFVCKLNKIEPESGNYMKYYRCFEKNRSTEFINSNGDVYCLQQIVLKQDVE